jgi:hypothetical protein
LTFTDLVVADLRKELKNIETYEVKVGFRPGKG